MKRLIPLLAILALGAGACSRARSAPRAKAQQEMRTIDSANIVPTALNPPPMLTDEAPPPKVKDTVAGADAPPPPTTEDEAMRAALPFAPAIGMDPVDGSKISIRAHTPTVMFKNKLYYFSSEENKRLFNANPEQYVKGRFSHI